MAFPKQQHDEPSAMMGTVGVSTTVDHGNINDLMVCSYDEAHVCGAGRYHTHLKDCRKAKGYTDKKDDGSALDAEGKPEPEPEPEMVVCPFNQSHHVHRSVLTKHVTLCDSYYMYCMETQVEPPSMRRERKRGRVTSGGSSQGASSTDTDTDTEAGIESGSQDTDPGMESGSQKLNLRRNNPEEVARRLAAMQLVAEDIDADGNPIVFSSASDDEDEDPLDEVYYSAASDIEQ